MRCIVVNGANLKADAYCSYCRNKISDRYTREIGSRFLYCDFACYQHGNEAATGASGYVAPLLNAWTFTS